HSSINIHSNPTSPPHPYTFPYTTLFRSLAIKGHSHGQYELPVPGASAAAKLSQVVLIPVHDAHPDEGPARRVAMVENEDAPVLADRKSTRLNSSHVSISYAVFCLKKKTN